ncbi:sulfurtransferase TusA family protein [Photobacterium aphoticum]|uniref:SirA-like family protein n=2 Tax=Photobacterium aphoticum TaxID=754436 RepID=A0A0J1GHQ5_9GAMM|nr:sulfurtransferase TusA family protein [Photobacterium aphoticum]KLU99222.1 sirA-like family protein [Photobacterium aphoticum]PSU56232.1 sulfurtransferase TusA family protein [Photobacterium aphoticum]
MLDLTAERCPMALLLAKRATHALERGEHMEIHMTDAGARQDIPRYLTRHGFEIKVQADTPQVLAIIVTKGR